MLNNVDNLVYHLFHVMVATAGIVVTDFAFQVAFDRVPQSHRLTHFRSDFRV
jgi:hypothetical protein